MNISIFDLDGTLIPGNSHIDVIKKWKKSRIYDALPTKIFGALFPGAYLRWLYRVYDTVPESFIARYQPGFRTSMHKLLQDRLAQGDEVIVISNAPQAILDRIHAILQIPVYQAAIGKKADVLQARYAAWDHLLVVTDNLSDANIIELADEAIIFYSWRNKHRFMKLRLPANTVMKSRKEE